MPFVQVIEGRTSKIDEIMKLEEEWRKATEGKRTLLNSVVGRDRNDPEHFMVLAYFESYESAMANSNLPETGEFAKKQMALLDGPPTFYDLDVD
jgi:quinol monooxygenase YgiN